MDTDERAASLMIYDITLLRVFVCGGSFSQCLTIMSRTRMMMDSANIVDLIQIKQPRD